MEKEKITPEERLLKIIESPDVKKRPIPLSVKVRGMGMSSFKDWFKNIHIDKDVIKHVNFRSINIAVAVICILITLIWIFSFIKSGIAAGRRFKQVVSQDISASGEDKRPNIDVSIDDALSRVRRRNMMTFLPSKEEVASSVSIGPSLSNFKLVGILWSDNPQAMIENTKDQKTYFVSKGDTIGELEVKNIFGDKVIVGKGSEEWELR